MTVQQNDIMQVSSRAEFGGIDDVVNGWQFQKTDPVPATDLGTVDDLIDILETLMLALQAIMTSVLIWRDLRVSNITQGTVLGVFPWDLLTSGQNNFDAVPPGCAQLWSFSTGIPRVTLRKYIGVYTEDNLDDPGVWGAGATTLGASQAALLLNPLNGAVGTYRYGFLSPKTASFVTPTGVVVTNIPAYQRRRRQGRGS